MCVSDMCHSSVAANFPTICFSFCFSMLSPCELQFCLLKMTNIQSSNLRQTISVSTVYRQLIFVRSPSLRLELKFSCENSILTTGYVWRMYFLWLKLHEIHSVVAGCWMRSLVQFTLGLHTILTIDWKFSWSSWLQYMWMTLQENWNSLRWEVLWWVLDA